MKRTEFNAPLLGADVLAPPRTFEAVLGRTNAVANLRKRVQAGKHRMGLILHGPAGVGKRTLARLYAKAVLCEVPTAGGSPCNSCQTCQAFDEGRSWGYIEIDVEDGRAEERARELVRRTWASSLADRRVIVIANADAYAPTAFDVLLKTLEETPTTFVFLARELRRVRLAGRSRCESVRLRPLDPSAAREHLSILCGAHGFTCDERVLDVLIAAGLGLPGQLREVCARVAGAGELTLETARRALGLDWVEGMIAHWHAVLSDEALFAATLAPPAEVRTDEQVKRLRVFLQYLNLHGLREPPVRGVVIDPALLYDDDVALTELVTVFRKRADAQGVSSQALWNALAEHWLSTDRLANLTAQD